MNHIPLRLLAFFLIWIPSIALGQSFELLNGDTINKTDQAGKKQGRWIIKAEKNNPAGFAEGAVMEEVFYKDGKKEGMRKQYHYTGKLKSEVPYKDNRPSGYCKFYYSDGVIAEEGNWNYGGWDGKYKNYYEGGSVENDFSYSYGKKDGYQRMYYPTGKVKTEGNWKNGIPEGMVKEYDENGVLQAEEFYSNGIVDTKASKYYGVEISSMETTEVPDSVGVFTGNGFYKFKTKSGKVSKEGIFKAGKLMDGKHYFYDGEGKLRQTIIYKEGKATQTIEEK